MHSGAGCFSARCCRRFRNIFRKHITLSILQLDFFLDVLGGLLLCSCFQCLHSWFLIKLIINTSSVCMALSLQALLAILLSLVAFLSSLADRGFSLLLQDCPLLLSVLLILLCSLCSFLFFLETLFFLSLQMKLPLLLLLLDCMHFLGEFLVSFLFSLPDVFLTHLADCISCIFPCFFHHPLLLLDIQSLRSLEVTDVVAILQVFLLSQCLFLGNVAVALLLELRLQFRLLSQLRRLCGLASPALFECNLLSARGLCLLLLLLPPEMINMLQHELVAGMLLQ
mmetsp:Transcript_49368/g.90727  ORF Transcript_49368/g.90727 Transcript_49368/m.90727 type:complete len:282 (+) Transcript_49368:59-904(+)